MKTYNENPKSKKYFKSRNRISGHTKNNQNKRPINPKTKLNPTIEMSWRGHAINWSRQIMDGDICMGQVKMISDKCVKVAIFKNITRGADINKWAKLYIHAISDNFITSENFKNSFDVGDILVVEISDAQQAEITLKPKYCGGISVKCDKSNCGVFTPGPICHNCNRECSKKMANVKYIIKNNYHYIVVNNLRLLVY